MDVVRKIESNKPVKEVKIVNSGAETGAEPFAVAKEDAKD